MANIELVIKISEEDFERCKKRFQMRVNIMGDAIANGIPLPKGHGRLIDADSMKTMKNIQSANFNAVELIRLWIDKQPIIIKADKVESEEV